ncbi:MAG: hypothetical protein Q9208_007498 [Pyrenodesmia sp. 3 TL-2023]
MATNGLYQALTDLESLLYSRKKLVNSEVTIVYLDRIIVARLSSFIEKTTNADLKVDGPSLLDRVTLIREQMKTINFNLDVVEELVSKVVGQMCTDAQVDQKPLAAFDWSEIIKFHVCDSLTGTYATKEPLGFNPDLVGQILWSQQSTKIQVDYFHYEKSGRRRLFIKMGNDEDCISLHLPKAPTMKSEELHQALLDLNILLETRKDFNGNRAQIGNLDQLARGRITSVTKRFSNVEVAGNGTLILHKIGEIRNNAMAVNYDLSELDNLMGSIVEQMRVEDQKRFLHQGLYNWSIPLVRFTAAAHVASTGSPHKYLDLAFESKGKLFQLYDGYKNQSASNKMLEFATPSIKGIGWSIPKNKICVKVQHSVNSDRLIFLELLSGSDAQKLFDKLHASGLVKPIEIILSDAMEVQYANRLRKDP